jgi:hypothetical protein
MRRRKISLPDEAGRDPTANLSPDDSASDKEVVVMSQRVLSVNSTTALRTLVFAMLLPALQGCVSAAKDVRDYYREMAYNYHAAQEKAKMDALTLEGESKLLAKNGDFQRLKRTQRELDRIKAWEAKCAKQEERFEKAAIWTEERYHLDRPPAKAKSVASLDEEKPATTEGPALPPLFEAKDL